MRDEEDGPVVRRDSPHERVARKLRNVFKLTHPQSDLIARDLLAEARLPDVESLKSDFVKAVARIYEGHCPLCDERLVARSTDLYAAWGECEPCEVEWRITVLEDRRTMLWPTRELRPDEIQRLYDRTREGHP